MESDLVWSGLVWSGLVMVIGGSGQFNRDGGYQMEKLVGLLAEWGWWKGGRGEREGGRRGMVYIHIRYSGASPGRQAGRQAGRPHTTQVWQSIE